MRDLVEELLAYSVEIEPSLRRHVCGARPGVVDAQCSLIEVVCRRGEVCSPELLGQRRGGNVDVVLSHELRFVKHVKCCMGQHERGLGIGKCSQ